jgi:hypothetical protein
MNGFLIVGLIAVAALSLFVVHWLRARRRRTGALPPPPGARVPLGEEPPAPTRPLYQVREGGDGGGGDR